MVAEVNFPFSIPVCPLSISLLPILTMGSSSLATASASAMTLAHMRPWPPYASRPQHADAAQPTIPTLSCSIGELELHNHGLGQRRFHRQRRFH